MSIYDVISNILLTIAYGWSLIWVFLAWGIGVTNFAQKHGRLLGGVGYSFWLLLVLFHGFSIYALWVDLFSVLWLVALLLTSHFLFGFIFGRNLSAH